MVTRYTELDNDPSLPPTVRKARQTLRRQGWTQSAAAAALGVHRVHLTMVLTGRRESRSLLRRIAALPAREEGRP